MSVLACERYGCENIMCDRLSYKYGYICNECFEELVDLGVGTDIKEFMESPKEKSFRNWTSSYNFFNDEFQCER